MIRLTGIENPTRAQVHEAIEKISDELRRGESVCFPIYESDGTNRSLGWYFVGMTTD
jgi:hypothetical protein